jgi:hypothetical protein
MFRPLDGMGRYLKEIWMNYYLEQELKFQILKGIRWTLSYGNRLIRNLNWDGRAHGESAAQAGILNVPRCL